MAKKTLIVDAQIAAQRDRAFHERYPDNPLRILGAISPDSYEQFLGLVANDALHKQYPDNPLQIMAMTEEGFQVSMPPGEILQKHLRQFQRFADRWMVQQEPPPVT